MASLFAKSIFCRSVVKKNIKLNSHDNPKEEKNRFGLSRKWLNENFCDFDFARISTSFVVKELLEKKNIKKQFFFFFLDYNLIQFVILLFFLAVGL